MPKTPLPPVIPAVHFSRFCKWLKHRYLQCFAALTCGKHRHCGVSRGWHAGNAYVSVSSPCDWPEHPCPNDDYVRVTSACDWPEHPCPHDDYVRVTSACDWPEHPCPRDDYVRVTSACDWPEHPCPHDAYVRVTSACDWPEHPCPNDAYVRVTSACDWPEHPCPNDAYVRVASACDWPEHPCPNDDYVRVITRSLRLAKPFPPRPLFLWFSLVKTKKFTCLGERTCTYVFKAKQQPLHTKTKKNKNAKKASAGRLERNGHFGRNLTWFRPQNNPKKNVVTHFQF